MTIAYDRPAGVNKIPGDNNGPLSLPQGLTVFESVSHIFPVFEILDENQSWATKHCRRCCRSMNVLQVSLHMPQPRNIPLGARVPR